MGLFGKLKNMRGQRQQKRMDKAVMQVGSSRTIKEERMDAITHLARMDETEVAVPALLSRFNFSLEHGIQDEREKAAAMEGILNHKEAALPIVTNHLKNSDKIAWPVKILQKITTEDKIVEALKEALIFEDTSFDMGHTDKNYDVLCYLRDYKLPGFHAKLGHFLNDPDERVRFAAIEVLVEQDEPQIALLLERFIADDSPDNIRIREKVIRCFLDRGWKLKNTEPYLDGFVIPGVKVNKQGELKESR